MCKHPQAQLNSIFAEISSTPEDEVKYREMNGKGEAQLECHAPSYGVGSQVQPSLGSKGDGDPHGSSEDLLVDYDDLPVEIGQFALSRLDVNLTDFTCGVFKILNSWARGYCTCAEYIG